MRLECPRGTPVGFDDPKADDRDCVLFIAFNCKGTVKPIDSRAAGFYEMTKAFEVEVSERPK